MLFPADFLFLDDTTLVAGGSEGIYSDALTVYDLAHETGKVLDDDPVLRVRRAGATRTIVYSTGSLGSPTGVWAITLP
jgi:hypothetical protein